MDILTNGASILGEAWDWISSNVVIGGIIGLAVLLIAIGGFIRLFIK